MNHRFGLACGSTIFVLMFQSSGIAAENENWIGRKFMPRQHCKLMIENREIPA
jgi:hypothetical protein